MSAAAKAAAEADDTALSDNQDLDQCCSSPIPSSGSDKSSIGVSPSSPVKKVTAIVSTVVAIEKTRSLFQQHPHPARVAAVATKTKTPLQLLQPVKIATVAEKTKTLLQAPQSQPAQVAAAAGKIKSSLQHPQPQAA
jgi:hypothetical protein